MRKIVISLLSVIIIVGSIHAQNSGLGFGLSTDGLNAKYWMGGSTAISAHWDLESTISADYLLHNSDMLNVSSASTPVHYGLGVLLGTSTGIDDQGDETNELHLGVRGVAGVSYYLSAYPMDVFLELTPTLGLLGSSGLDIHGALGVRYFF